LHLKYEEHDLWKKELTKYKHIKNQKKLFWRLCFWQQIGIEIAKSHVKIINKGQSDVLINVTLKNKVHRSMDLKVAENLSCDYQTVQIHYFQLHSM
jgi:hypothetical protein